jgi:magnesium transporter
LIRIFRAGAATSQVVDSIDDAFRLPPDVIWLDLIAPTRDEELVLENRLNLPLPTREEMIELEASSRLYRENGATYATADLIHNGDADIPAIDPVTFVLTSGPLITIRYFNPRPFAMVDERFAREPGLCTTPAEVFLQLM